MNSPSQPVVERLTCPRCSADMMIVQIQEGGTQKIVCAGCGDLVGYTSDLVRVLVSSKSPG
jgi:hypothetical protein